MAGTRRRWRVRERRGRRKRKGRRVSRQQEAMKGPYVPHDDQLELRYQ